MGPEYTDFKEYFQDSLYTSVYQILKKNFASDCLILNAECDLGRVELSHDDDAGTAEFDSAFGTEQRMLKLLVSELLPAQSEHVPLIWQYFCVTIVVIVIISISFKCT